MNGEEILKEMNGFAMNESREVPEQCSGDKALPFESLDDYSTDPIGFEEVADMVSSKVRYFFSLSVKYNHRSSDYLEVCGILERGIKYLGSCCLTKVLLKKNGHDLPKLEDLSTHWLYGIVSFNIRKLNRTVDEDLSRSGTLPSKWLDMQFRYINLAERLKSTETKIFEFTSYYWLNSDKYVKHALMFSEKAYNRADVKKHIRKPDFRMAPSFPVLTAVSEGTVQKGTGKSRKELSTETQRGSAVCKANGDPQTAAGGSQQEKNWGSDSRDQKENTAHQTENGKKESGSGVQGTAAAERRGSKDTDKCRKEVSPGTETKSTESTAEAPDPFSNFRIPRSLDPVILKKFRDSLSQLAGP